MKKLIPALLLGLALAVSCKKDNKTSIVGKWTLAEGDTIATSPSGSVLAKRATVHIASEGYTQFNADGTGYSSIPANIVYDIVATPQNGFGEVAGNFSYTVSGNNIVINYTQKSDGLTILPFQATVSFNGDEMVFTKKIDDSKSSNPAIYTFILHYKKSN